MHTNYSIIGKVIPEEYQEPLKAALKDEKSLEQADETLLTNCKVALSTKDILGMNSSDKSALESLKTRITKVLDQKKLNKARALELGAFVFREALFPTFPSKFQDPILKLIKSEDLIKGSYWEENYEVVEGRSMLDEGVVFDGQLLSMIDDFSEQEKFGLLFQFPHFPTVTEKVLKDSTLDFRLSTKDLVIKQAKADKKTLPKRHLSEDGPAANMPIGNILILRLMLMEPEPQCLESILNHPNFHFSPLPNTDYKVAMVEMLLYPEANKDTVDKILNNEKVKKALSEDKEFLEILGGKGDSGLTLVKQIES